MPVWGTKSWEFCSAILAIILCGLGIWYVVLGLSIGSPVVLYNSTVFFFAISLIGLLLLVRESKNAIVNVLKFGRNPAEDQDSMNDDPLTLSAVADDT